MTSPLLDAGQTMGARVTLQLHGHPNNTEHAKLETTSMSAVAAKYAGAIDAARVRRSALNVATAGTRTLSLSHTRTCVTSLAQGLHSAASYDLIARCTALALRLREPAYKALPKSLADWVSAVCDTELRFQLRCARAEASGRAPPGCGVC